MCIYLFFLVRCTMLGNSSAVIPVVKICCWWVQEGTWRLCSKLITLLVILYKSKPNFKSYMYELCSSKRKFWSVTSPTVIIPVRVWIIFTKSLMKVVLSSYLFVWELIRGILHEWLLTIVCSEECLKRGLHNVIIWAACMNKYVRMFAIKVSKIRYFWRNIRLT